MGLPTDPYKWGDQKKTIQERMQGFDVKPSPAQPEDTTPPPGTPPNPEQIQTPEGAVDDAMAPTYGEPRQKTPEELEENPGVVRVHGINPDALDPSLAGGVPQQGDQPQPGAPGAQPGVCEACGQPLKAPGADKAQMSKGVSGHSCPVKMAKVEVRGRDADILYQAPQGYFVKWKAGGPGKIEGPFDTLDEAKKHVAASGKELSADTSAELAKKATRTLEYKGVKYSIVKDLNAGKEQWTFEARGLDFDPDDHWYDSREKAEAAAKELIESQASMSKMTETEDEEMSKDVNKAALAEFGAKAKMAGVYPSEPIDRKLQEEAFQWLAKVSEEAQKLIDRTDQMDPSFAENNNDVRYVISECKKALNLLKNLMEL